jgi:hypothetical protein
VATGRRRIDPDRYGVKECIFGSSFRGSLFKTGFYNIHISFGSTSTATTSTRQTNTQRKRYSIIQADKIHHSAARRLPPRLTRRSRVYV